MRKPVFQSTGTVKPRLPYNSNFRYFEIKSLVPRTSNLQDFTVNQTSWLSYSYRDKLEFWKILDGL